VLRIRHPALRCQETTVRQGRQALLAYLVLLDSIVQVVPVRSPHAKRWLETTVLLAHLCRLGQLVNRVISVLAEQQTRPHALLQLAIIVFRVPLVQLGRPAPKVIGVRVDRQTKLYAQQRQGQGTTVQVAHPRPRFVLQGSIVQVVHRTKSLAQLLLATFVQLDLLAVLDRRARLGRIASVGQGIKLSVKRLWGIIALQALVCLPDLPVMPGIIAPEALPTRFPALQRLEVIVHKDPRRRPERLAPRVITALADLQTRRFVHLVQLAFRQDPIALLATQLVRE